MSLRPRVPAIVAVACALLIAGSVAHADGGRPFWPPVSLGTFDGTLDEMAAYHTTWTRYSASWDANERAPGEYDWAAVDAFVLPRSQAGLRIIVMVHSNAVWATNCASPYTFSAPKPDRIDDFREYVRRMVERYDGDGLDDAPGLEMPIKHWQIENQWVTSTFYRGSDNCATEEGFGDPSRVVIATEGHADGGEVLGNPRIAAREYAKQYIAAFDGAREADPTAQVGPGNIPSQTADAFLFCQRKLGPVLKQNVMNLEGEVVVTREWTRYQVCDARGENLRNIKQFSRYWRVVLNRVFHRLPGRISFVDFAHYGPYRNVALRNTWVSEKLLESGFKRVPRLAGWELAGPDRRTTLPSKNPLRDVALDIPKRLSVAFASGTSAATWFHNGFNLAAAVGVRWTSLKHEDGTPAPAYYAYRQYADAVHGATSATLEDFERGPKLRGTTVTYTFPGERRVTIAWSDRQFRGWIGLDSPSASVTPIDGSPSPVTVTRQTNGGRLWLRLTNVPLLIEH